MLYALLVIEVVILVALAVLFVDMVRNDRKLSAQIRAMRPSGLWVGGTRVAGRAAADDAYDVTIGVTRRSDRRVVASYGIATFGGDRIYDALADAVTGIKRELLEVVLPRLDKK